MKPDFDDLMARAWIARDHDTLLARARAARVDAAVRREILAEIAVENAIVRIRSEAAAAAVSPEVDAVLRRNLLARASPG